MSRRSALMTLLGLAAVPGGWGGPAAYGRGGLADIEPVAHRPDVRRFQPHRMGVGGIAFSPDGDRLVTVGRRDRIKVWDARSGRELLAFGDAEDDVHRLAYSRDGRRIAACGVDGWIERHSNSKRWRVPAGFAIKVWDAATGHELAKIKGPTSFEAVAFGADGKTLTSLDFENRLQVWEIAGARELAAVKGNFPEGNRHTGVNRWVAFDAGARRVALSTTDIERDGEGHPAYEAALKLWDVDGRRFRNLAAQDHFPFVTGGDCLLSPDGARIITAHLDRIARRAGGGAVGLRRVAIIDFERGTVVRHIEPDLATEELLFAFSPDGRRVLSARPDGVLRLWDVADGRVVWTIRGPEGMEVPREKGKRIAALAVAFLPDGIRVASGGVRGWNEIDPVTHRIISDPITGEVYHVEPLQVWDAELDWSH